ncbi:MAG: hypothetical protein Q4G04_00480 [bacterium]|nr:hypothetical protein [bacterium]
MNNDKEIKKVVSELQEQCNDFLSYIDSSNECAYSDRMLEDIIKKGNYLSELYEINFSNKKINNKYEYEIDYYCNDNDDLYVGYFVTNNETSNRIQCIECYNTSDLKCNYNNSSPREIEIELLDMISENNGEEFNLPKISGASHILKFVFDSVNQSEANMCHITDEEWEELKDDEIFIDYDINILKNEIKEYGLSDYITIDSDGYKICGYGGLQTRFINDEKGNGDEFER